MKHANIVENQLQKLILSDGIKNVDQLLEIFNLYTILIVVL